MLNALFKSKKFYTKDFVDAKYKSNIGEFTYGDPIIMDWDEGSKLYIGKFCSISSNVLFILGGNHRFDWITTYPFSSKPKMWPKAKNIVRQSITKGDIVVGNDVWFGTGATILSGVTIGDGAVIGAKSVVTKNVEPYAIVAGNPAKIIRKRFSEDKIKKLLTIKWWDWPIEKIQKNVVTLCSNKVDQIL